MGSPTWTYIVYWKLVYVSPIDLHVIFNSDDDHGARQETRIGSEATRRRDERQLCVSTVSTQQVPDRPEASR
jgi:hypothetical protein